MSSKQFFKIAVTLSSGSKSVLYLGRSNFSVNQNTIGQVSITDTSQRNGSYVLATEETFEAVCSRIDEAMEKAGLL